MSKENPLQKKAPKRFTYPISALVEINNMHQPTQIQNISKTGIQFASNFSIPKNARIHMTWQDSKVGPVESHIMVVRDISQRKVSGFSYCYGSKFTNARHDVKKNVNRLVEMVQAEERENDLRMLEKATFQAVSDIINQGGGFLRGLLNGEKSPFRLMDRYAKELTPYEKQSFQHTDEQSLWIQKLVTQHFHCRILSAALNSIELKILKVSNAQKMVHEKLRVIPFLIEKFEEFLDVNALASDENTFRDINETVRRLIYSYLELSEVFTKLGKLQTRTF